MEQHLITANKAKEMISNYQSNQYADLEAKAQKSNYHETKAIWFSIEVLEDYIKLLKQHKNIDGVRIYMSAYGNSPSPNHGYTKRQTVVLVPTKPGDAESPYNIQKHKDVYKDNNDELKLLKLETQAKSPVNEGQLLLLNEGTTYPPPPPFN